MNEDVKITQKAAIGSNVVQIANQNNYYGLTAQEASDLAIKLFMDNFPKLQEDARRVAEERAKELHRVIIAKLERQGKKDFSEFSDPDVQYILNKSHCEYARFGTVELCGLLSEIIISRINYDNDYYIKILLDEAVDVVKSLTEYHLNYLSLIFLCKEAKINNINTIETLQNHCKDICSKLPVPDNIGSSIPFLNMHRLLTLSLGVADDIYSKRYNLDLDEVKKILPSEIKAVPGDYGLSPLGIIIAIINIQKKTDMKPDPKIWLKTV